MSPTFEMEKVTKLSEMCFKTGGEQTPGVQDRIPKMLKQRTILHTAPLTKYLKDSGYSNTYLHYMNAMYKLSSTKLIPL
jgi:hypothetical protein